MRLAGNPTRRSARFLVVLVSTIVAVVAASAGRTACSTTRNGGAEPPFAADSPWRQAIPERPSIDPGSAAMIGHVQSTRGVFANLVQYGVPIFTAQPGTPEYRVQCVGQNWGICPFAGWPVPIPAGAQPNSGSDAAMVTVDKASGTVFEFWRASRAGDQWSTQWGAVNSLHGSGWGGAATGSGASRLAGVIRVAEISAGAIPHALALQTNNACSTFRPPALKSDGTSLRTDCLPEGARLQLDPALDLTTLGLRSGELAVATAMQTYGGYVVDAGGAPLSVSFELDTSAPPPGLGKVYQAAGFRWDYDPMDHVPWEKLRVLS